MNVLSLCSGVGLIDLGLEWAGMRTVQLCEIDAYAASILENRYPGVPIHDDVWTIEPEECDVIAAGFPCQPFSVAGKQLGDADPRHLWPAIMRSIRLVRPRYVLLENVPGLVAWGLGEVLGDLAAAGYDAEWTVFGASDVGAPHRRKRWWCVATSDPDRSRVWDTDGGFFREAWATSALTWAHGQTRELQPGRAERVEWGRSGDRSAEGGDVADTDGVRCVEGLRESAGRNERSRPGDAQRGGEHARDVADSDGVGRERWPGEQWTGRRGQPQDSRSADGWWSTERGLGRVAHRQPNRMDRLKCLGNGVVPQCAELIGLRIMQLDGVTTKSGGLNQ